ncbi:MAG TPA: LysM peptidoglycan-binding domain-containing protein [Nocardioides sp.]|nr:LysM peptidoglycan-binding domain-containing protein [Nocardioides sp.]
MDHARTTAARRRAALLWAVVTGLIAALASVAGPVATSLATDPAPRFDALLVQACAALSLVAAGALWLATTDVALDVLRRSGPVRRDVGPVRAALLALCGVAVLSGTTIAHAAAHDGPRAPLAAGALDGLPLPDRAEGGAGSRDNGAPVVQVRPGDSLWSIAARTLGPHASAADLTSYWHRIHARNATTIGPDPDLVHPGQRLHLPPTH